jgi:hypothetical protein
VLNGGSDTVPRDTVDEETSFTLLENKHVHTIATSTIEDPSLHKDRRALHTSNDVLAALCVDIRSHDIFAFGNQAWDFDRLRNIQRALLDRTAETNIRNLFAEVDLLRQEGDRVVFDRQEQFRARLDILRQGADRFDGQILAPGKVPNLSLSKTWITHRKGKSREFCWGVVRDCS